MTRAQEERAWEAFEAELAATRDPKAALRAALIDFIVSEQAYAPAFPGGGGTASSLPRGLNLPEVAPDALLRRHQGLLRSICDRAGANFRLTASHCRASGREIACRAVLIKLLSATGLNSRELAVGTGWTQASICHLLYVFDQRPVWLSLYAEFKPLFEAAA
jgi:hypothetical protein